MCVPDASGRVRGDTRPMAQIISDTLTQHYVAQRSFDVMDSTIPADLTISEWRASRARHGRRSRVSLRAIHWPFSSS